MNIKSDNEQNLLAPQYQMSPLAFEIAALAERSLLYEVMSFPKPGLVTPISSGAHRDMDMFTFIDSSSVLIKYFALAAMNGLSHQSPKEQFLELRTLGVQAEQEMLEATEGVNTHKGLIFLMGIACNAVAKAYFEKRSHEEISTIIRDMTQGIVKSDLAATKKREYSHGERIYLKHGIAGVREEAEQGLPTVFLSSLPFYQQNADLSNHSRLLQTLLKIMTTCQDTTIIHRANREALFEIQESAKEILRIGGVRTKEGRNEVDRLCGKCLIDNISPGGSADLLAVTVFFHFTQKFW